MPPELLNLLIQLPVVAAFIWYSERINRQFQEFLREERAAREKSIERLAEKLDDHDQTVRAAISRMEERTRPRKEYAD